MENAIHAAVQSEIAKKEKLAAESSRMVTEVQRLRAEQEPERAYVQKNLQIFSTILIMQIH